MHSNLWDLNLKSYKMFSYVGKHHTENFYDFTVINN